MEKLNFPDFDFSFKSKENKPYIFDPIRKKWVILYPEEWVRQLMSSVDRGDYQPFYLLSGAEPYFIDRLEAKITDQLTDEASRSFDYSLFYGKEVEASSVN